MMKIKPTFVVLAEVKLDEGLGLEFLEGGEKQR